MCLIAYRPAHTGKGKRPRLAPEVIDNAFVKNPDGFGLVWRTDTGLGTRNFAPSDIAEARKAIASVDASGAAYAMHWRLATHGPKDAEHTHPYVYMDPDPSVGQIAVLHNGVIDIATKPHESDTQAFVEQVLAHMPSRWWTLGWANYLVSEAIGWSKLAIFTATETALVNETMGTWDSGIWYSSAYKPIAAWKPPVKPAVVTAPVAVPQSVATLVETAQRGRNAHKAARKQARSTPMQPVVRIVDREPVFRHAGHGVTLTRPSPASDGTVRNGVRCDTCETIGDVYRFDSGPLFFDLTHKEAVR